MTNVLYLTSSPSGSTSYSNRVAGELIQDMLRRDPDAKVTHRDLAGDPLPHIDADFVAATKSAEGPQTDRQRALLAQSDALVDELLAADTVVIAAGMINFSIPSTLKTWIDYVARAGRTFSYGEGGPKGLATGKQVVLIVARGGVYSGDNAAMDFQVPYLRKVLGFLGMTDVEVFDVDGTAYGPDAAEKAVAATSQRMQQRCREVAAA